MTAAFDRPTSDSQNPGGATVGDLHAIEGDRALAILMYRDWFDGTDGRERVASVFDQALGSEGDHALATWTTLMTELVVHARRPLIRHGLSCRCIGADEAVFAQILALAMAGEREEALMILSLLIPADRSLPALHAAERCGCNLRRCALRFASAIPADSTLHRKDTSCDF